ncbi:MAG: hypothetical protein ABS89_09210 [Thiobacillus sp. SCN 63-1177]|nr:MAG: hypothetical protein ABS89_09210 [Thiobacillus sp. SCN 63-1177]
MRASCSVRSSRLVAKQAFRAAAGLDRRDADAGGGDVAVAVALAQQARGLQQLRVRQRLEEQGELVAAQPGGQLGSRPEFAQTLGHMLDHHIAGAVAGQIVDRLEVVEIDQQQRTACRLGQRLGQPPLKALAVVQAGQRVVIGQITGACLRALEFGHVQPHRQHQRLGTVFLADQRMHPGNIAQPAGGGEQRFKAQRRELAAKVRQQARTPVAAFLRGDHLLEIILPDQPVCAEAGERFDVAVGHADRPTPILRQDQRLRRVQHPRAEVPLVRQGVDQLGQFVLLVARGRVERFELAGEGERGMLQRGELVARQLVVKLQVPAGVVPAAFAEQRQAGADAVHPLHEPGKRYQQYARQAGDQIGQERPFNRALRIAYVHARDEVGGAGHGGKRLQFLPFVYFAAAVAQGGFELRTLRMRREIRLLHHGLDIRCGGGEQLGGALMLDSDG